MHKSTCLMKGSLSQGADHTLIDWSADSPDPCDNNIWAHPKSAFHRTDLGHTLSAGAFDVIMEVVYAGMTETILLKKYPSILPVHYSITLTLHYIWQAAAATGCTPRFTRLLQFPTAISCDHTLIPKFGLSTLLLRGSCIAAGQASCSLHLPN